MPDVARPVDGTIPAPPLTAGLDESDYPPAAEAALGNDSPSLRRVGWGFIALYALAFMSTSLLFIAPLLVSLALKINSLVGIKQAPNSLASSPESVPWWQWSVIRSSAG